MLYRATRNKLDSFTAYRALHLDRATDGGFLLPMQIPVMEQSAIEKMGNRDFLQNVADLLNMFFATDLTMWDLESAIGKTPLKMEECGQKTVIVQCWNNPGGSLNYILQCVFSRLYPEKGAIPSTWARVAIRISLISAAVMVYSDRENSPIDIAVNAGDFEQAFAAYYCRKLGFPIRKILIACNENSGLWDFAFRGTMPCGASVKVTPYPALDKVVPDLFEAYLFTAYGEGEAQRFVNALKQKAVYQLPEDARLPVDDDLFVSVVGHDRINTVIGSFRSNNGMIVNPYTAYSLGVTQDYRAKAGESCLTVIFEEVPPKV